MDMTNIAQTELKAIENQQRTSAQQQIQIAMLQQVISGDAPTGNMNPQTQMLQLITAVQPLQQIQQTAQSQIQKGYLDIKI